MIYRYNDFNIYERDIAGIENWSTQDIMEIEIEAMSYLNMKMKINDEVLESRRHAEHVAYKCDSIIKRRKERKIKEWELLFE